jgi:hypothetical protein
MKKILMCAIVLSVVALRLVYGEEVINENELFSNPQTDIVVPAPGIAATSAEEKKTVGFSGEITNAWIGVLSSRGAKTSLYTYTVANIFLDARLKRDSKVYANMETTYLSQTKLTEVALRELFFDFNIRRSVYFRTGKQVLQWGRCYLWNPTDLINVERVSFVRKIGYREGAYGLKMHVPFGTKANIYGFLDTGNAPNAEDVGGAIKYEFLVGNSEMAFSGWSKAGYHPVLGYDFSTRLGTFDWAGEATVSKGENRTRIIADQGTLSLTRRDEEISPRLSMNFTKRLRLGNFKDRITLIAEGYYNHAGYDENQFDDGDNYSFVSPTIGFAGLPLTSGTRKDYILGNNLYLTNEFSRYYAAFLGSLSRFIITDMTLNVNVLQNASDGSGIISTGVSYQDINDFSAGLLINAAYGQPNREFTYANQSANIQLTFSLAF